MDYVADDAAELVRAGQRLVLVHGAGNEANALGEKVGYPARHVTSPQGFTWRYTDRQTLEIYAMAAVGKINTFLVESLQKRGVNAVGLSGVSGRVMEGTRKDAVRIVEGGKQRILRDDFTGRVEKVNSDLLCTLLDKGYLPVIAPLAISFQGEAMNVDGDRAAAMVAGAIGAEKLIILTNVVALDFAEGRMKKKVLGASEALKLGVGHVVFADGRIEHPIQHALDGKGTIIG
jgi:acetylglutamate/LysW-gamma-L-alpha-aminoadipate kinase